MEQSVQIPDVTLLESLESDYVKNVYNKIAVKFDLTRTYYWACVKEFLNSIDKTFEKKILDVYSISILFLQLIRLINI